MGIDLANHANADRTWALPANKSLSANAGISGEMSGSSCKLRRLSAPELKVLFRPESL
jgi:hypothetical protein